MIHFDISDFVINKFKTVADFSNNFTVQFIIDYNVNVTTRGIYRIDYVFILKYNDDTSTKVFIYENPNSYTNAAMCKQSAPVNFILGDVNVDTIKNVYFGFLHNFSTPDTFTTKDRFITDMTFPYVNNPIIANNVIKLM